MDSESPSAPLLMGDAPELNASPVRSAQLRSHAQHPGTPPRVAPPSQVARSPGGTPMAVISPKQRSPVGRLGSLDAVRGMTVCLMIFVDNVGDWLPHVNHSPWDDVTLADFVMPFFLFMVGCSMALSFSKYNGSIALTYKIIWRTVKLFIIGVATQGADLWGGGGFDMSNIRIPGILQRIAWAYFVVAIMSLYLPRLTTTFESPREANFEDVPGPIGVRVFRFYILHWVVALCFLWVYVTIMLGVTVPTWTYHLPQRVTNEQCEDPPSWDLPGTRRCTYTVLPPENITIHCNMRGDLTPKCSAARMVDQWLLGWSHMCSDLFAHRLPACSGCSPDNCPLPEDHRPGWCHVPFDPEGTLASMPTVLTTWIGMHFGLTLAHHKDAEGLQWVFIRWTFQSVILMLLGVAIHYGGWKMNKQLWSPSYLFFMAGACGGLLSVVFALLDYTEWMPRPLRTKWRLPSALQAASPTGPQRDSLDGALRSCIAADETLAEAQEELRARGVGLPTRKRLVALKAEISSVQRELKAAIKDESRSVRIPEVVLSPFVWVGMNTIFIYLLAPSGSLFNNFLKWFYWEGDRDDNPASWSYETFFCGRGDDYTHGSWDLSNPNCQRSEISNWAHTATQAECSMCLSGSFQGEYERDAQVLWTIVRILAWMGVAGWLHKIGWYWAL